MLHHLGPGHEFAPEPWVIACVSFDLVIAAYLVVAHRFGLARGKSQPRVDAGVQADTRTATPA